MLAAERVGVTRTSAEGLCSWRGRATPRSGGDPRGGHRSADPSPRPAPPSPPGAMQSAGWRAPLSPPSDQHRALAYIAHASAVQTSTERCLRIHKPRCLRMHKNWVRAVRYGPGADLPPASVLRSRRPPTSCRRPALIGPRATARHEPLTTRLAEVAFRLADLALIDKWGDGERHAQAVVAGIAGHCDLRGRCCRRHGCRCRVRWRADWKLQQRQGRVARCRQLQVGPERKQQLDLQFSGQKSRRECGSRGVNDISGRPGTLSGLATPKREEPLGSPPLPAMNARGYLRTGRTRPGHRPAAARSLGWHGGVRRCNVIPIWPLAPAASVTPTGPAPTHA